MHTSSLTSRAQLRAALLRDYRHFGQAFLLDGMQPYLSGLPKAPSAMRLKPLRSLWGSLNVADAITLDAALLFAPPEVAEYVLVHELCHLLQRNHSPKFWRHVEAACPDYRVARQWLRRHGPGLR